MYLILSAVVIVLLLFATPVGIGVLVAAIAWMVYQRTRPPTRINRPRTEESGYQPGYKD